MSKNFKVGDEIKLTKVSEGQEIAGGFNAGQTGTVIGFVATEYPYIKWDSPIITKYGMVIENSDVHFSRLSKIG